MTALTRNKKREIEVKSSKLNSSKYPLIADKELFRLWYEFYKLAVLSEDKKVKSALKKTASFYKQWGNDPNLHFDDWWVTHKHLFLDANRIRLADNEATGEGVLVWVPTGKSETLLVTEFQELLRENPERFDVIKRKKVVAHPFAPTEIQGLKREVLRMYLALQQRIFNQEKLRGDDLLERVKKFFALERYKRRKNKIPASFITEQGTRRGDHKEDAMRNVRRYRQKAAKLVLNVAEGVFPGRY